jgi:hypothetical protein
MRNAALSLAATASFLVLAPPSASAFTTSSAATFEPRMAFHPLVVKPGAVVNPPAATLSFADSSSTHVWAAGDRITFEMWDGARHGPLALRA